ncbi:MAG TPA: glycosyltransferase family 39 protein [Polyangiaceae bacterium]|jgi:hypothetical protein|nr:glycosyltransferase family 39 protein [Polyangiaceae bacterium]
MRGISRARGVDPYDAVAYASLFSTLAVVFATFRAYGIAWDEQGETVYGALLLKLYASGFHDHSAFEFVNFRFYGGGFELPAAIFAHLSPFGEYETRHLWSALLGVAGLAATWRVARRIGGPRGGVLALLLLLASPVWYGHMFINARDVPFGAGMACCLLLSLRALEELPELRLRTAALYGVSLGWMMSVRVGGIMALVFLLLPIALWLFGERWDGAAWKAVGEHALRIGVRLSAALGIAYAVMVAFWPWALQAPLNPLRALLMFSRFPFGGMELFEGRAIPASALPASYLPVLLWLKLPEVVLLGLGVAAFTGLRALHRRPRAPVRVHELQLLAVTLAALFPILYFVVARPTVYNGMRHFLFVVPPLTVLAALALERALQALPSRSLRAAMTVGLGLAVAVQVRTLMILHPEEYVYYNALAGGPRGAQGRYPLDYWGTSLEIATNRLVDELRRRDAVPESGEPPVKVFVCGNVWSASAFFPAWMSPVEHMEDADYQVAIAQFYCKHPAGSRPVLEVTRAGALLSYVDELRPAAPVEAKRDVLAPSPQ